MTAANHREVETEQEIARERERLLERVQDALEVPMLVLAFVWLGLFVIEVVRGLGPILTAAGYVIWGAFVVEFVVGFALAPGKGRYLRANWLKALAIAAPALRALRIARVVRLAWVSRLAAPTRGLRLLRVLSSINRGMKALGATMSRRGFGYAMLLTLLVTVAGAAGMLAFEPRGPHGAGFDSYGTALWWTAMIMTTMGTDYWPVSAEGRLLCLFLALYAFAVFGYVTATLASFFIGRDAEEEGGEIAGARAIAALHEEIAALRAELRTLDRRR